MSSSHGKELMNYYPTETTLDTIYNAEVVEGPTVEDNQTKIDSREQLATPANDADDIEKFYIDDENFPTIEARADHSQQNIKLLVEPGVYGLGLNSERVVDDESKKMTTYAMGKWSSDVKNALQHDKNTSPLIVQTKDGIVFRDSPFDDARVVIVTTDDEAQTPWNEVKYLGSEDEPVGVYVPKQGDTFLIANVSALEIISAAPNHQDVYHKLHDEDQIPAFIYVEMDNKTVNSMQLGAKNRAKLAQNKDNKQSDPEHASLTSSENYNNSGRRRSNETDKQPDTEDEKTFALSDESVTLLDNLYERTVGAKYAVSENSVVREAELDAKYADVDPKEYQEALDEERGLHNKEYQLPSEPKAAPTIGVEPALDAVKSLPEQQEKVVYKVVRLPKKPSFEPTVQLVSNNRASVAEHELTEVVSQSNKSIDDDLSASQPEAANKDEENNSKSKLQTVQEKLGKLRELPRWAAAYTMTRAAHWNDKRKEKAAESNNTSTDSDKEKRKKTRKQAAVFLMGVGAVVLANKMGVEGIDFTGGELPSLTALPEVNEFVDDASENIQEAFQKTVDQTQEMIDDAVQDLHELTALDVEVGATEQPPAPEVTPEQSDAFTAFVESTANIISNGGGGVEYLQNHNLDGALWYQHQNEFLQQFPNETYRMNDGNVGFARPGELSDAAKQFWATKAGL